MKNHIKYYQAAGITFKIISELPMTENTFHPKFNLFEVEDAGNDNVLIYHRFEKFDEHILATKRLVFSNEYLEVFSDNTDFFYKQKISQKYNIQYDTVAVFNKPHSFANVYICNMNASAYADACLDSVVFFGGDHYLFSNLLSNRNGLLVHGNSMAYADQGVLLIGRSGTGKSTLSAMLESDDFSMVGDDRTIIRIIDNNYFLFGSWCHGSTPIVSNKKLPFNKIFILNQSPDNRISPITSNHEKIQKIMQCIVKPFAMKQQWDNIFATVDNIISKINFYLLEFNLNGNIGQLVKECYERDPS